MTSLRGMLQLYRAPRESIGSKLTFLICFMFIAVPVISLFYGSLRSDSPGAPDAHFTLDNWLQVYGTATYRIAFLSTVGLSTVVGVLSVGLGAVLAWIVGRSNAPCRNALAPLLVVPLMISSLVTTLAWIALCAPNAGFINSLARDLFGIRTLFNIYSFSGIVLVLVLHYASFAFIPIYAVLRSIDGTLEEASCVVGASPLRTAVQMTLPLIWPVLASTFLLIFIFVAENFAAPALLGASSGFHTLASSIFYDISADPGNPPLAATAGTMLLWIALLGTLWQRRITANASRYVTIGGKATRQRTVELGRGRYFATSFILLYLFFAVVLPYSALVLASFMKFVTPRFTPAVFTTANYAKLMSYDYVLPTRNSLGFAVLGGLAAALLYVFLAYLIRRSPGWLGRLMDYVVIIPTVIPALVLGVGFVWAYIRLPLPIYGTAWILIIAYLTRFVGQGIRQSHAAFTQVSNDLTEAARTCGAPPLRAFRDVLLPLLRPALISLWTILFILIFMEISVTIVLYSPTTLTLPVLLWSRMQGGYQTEAFAVAVLQSTIVFVVLLIADRLFGTLRTALDS
jgi:iron(III) transport system permease protein